MTKKVKKVVNAITPEVAEKNRLQLEQTYPGLKEYWQEYFGEDHWNRVEDYAVAPTHKYVVVRYRDNKGQIQLSDFWYQPHAFRNPLKPVEQQLWWDMINDGFDPITEEQWNGLKFVPHRDDFVLPGDDNYDDY